jgi:hypothetical protein
LCVGRHSTSLEKQSRKNEKLNEGVEYVAELYDLFYYKLEGTKSLFSSSAHGVSVLDGGIGISDRERGNSLFLFDGLKVITHEAPRFNNI